MTETSTTQAQETEASHLAEAALDFARAAHAGRRRKQTGEPFIDHPVAVAELVASVDLGPDVLAAAYLHDVPEKTDVGVGEIRERFGDRVGFLVAVLTEDPTVADYAERKRALRAQVLASGRVPTVIYAADRVANLRDWTGVPPARREVVAALLGTSLEDRLLLWEEDLGELTGFDPGLPFLAEMQLELDSLREPAWPAPAGRGRRSPPAGD